MAGQEDCADEGGLNGNIVNEFTLEDAEISAIEAAECLRKKDWRTALTRLGRTLLWDPERQDWLRLLDQAIDLAGGEGQVLEFIECQRVSGGAIIAAYTLYKAGHVAAAFDELLHIIQTFPGAVLVECWAFSWLTDEVIRKLDKDKIAGLLFHIVQSYPDDGGSNEEALLYLNRALDVVNRLETVKGIDVQTVVLKGRLLSKSGRNAEAIRLTEGFAKKNPSFRSLTSAAMARRRNGDMDSAVKWLRRAADFDKDDETALLDIGDIRLAQGDWQNSLLAYEEAMQRHPDHDWAYPSAVYCRYRLSGQDKWLDQLRYMANAHPDECGMASMFSKMYGGYSYEDRRKRALELMLCIDPHFVPEPRPSTRAHEH